MSQQNAAVGISHIHNLGAVRDKDDLVHILRSKVKYQGYSYIFQRRPADRWLAVVTLCLSYRLLCVH